MMINGSTELARMNALARSTSGISHALSNAGREMSGGLKTDLHAATGGNKAKLHAIERALERNDAFSKNIIMAEQRLTVTQDALEMLQLPAEDLAINIVTASNNNNYTEVIMHAATARRDFVNSISTLNKQLVGQALFGGSDTSSQAMEEGEIILAELDLLVSGAADATAAIALIDEYFRKDPLPSGDYYNNAYLGSDADMASIEIGEGIRVDFPIRGDSDEIVDVLRSQAIGAVVGGGVFSGDPANELAMMVVSGDRMLAAKQELLGLRTGLGAVQEDVEDAKARNGSERNMFELNRLGYVAADPTAAATTFQALEAQLEAIYTITARLSNLSFTNYMR